MADDFVLNVKQIGQYPQKTTPTPFDAFLLQSGGAGGAYNWMAPDDLVSGALLNSTKFLRLSVTSGIAFNGAALTYSSGALHFSENFQAKAATFDSINSIGNITTHGATVATLTDLANEASARTAAINDLQTWTTGQINLVNQSIAATNAALNALTVEVNGIQQAVTEFVNASLDAMKEWTIQFIGTSLENTVHSFNGRHGDVVLMLNDIVFAGGAPIQSPRFEGIPSVPTPWDNTISDDRIASTAFVHSVVCQFMNDFLNNQPIVFSFNGRAGNIQLTTADVNAAYATVDGDAPTAPNPAPFDASNQIATTAWTADAVKDAATVIIYKLDADIQAVLDFLNMNFAPINNPQFTGVPSGPTAAPGSNTAQLATTAFVMAAVAASVAGVATWNGRSGNVLLETADITDAGGALLSSPIFVGNPTAPTAAFGTATAQLATTAFVANTVAAIEAGVLTFMGRSGNVTLLVNDLTSIGAFNSTTLTGVPTSPNPAVGNDSTQIATTHFVMANSVASFMGRTGAITLLANDISAAGGALLGSPIFTGNPQAPTQAAGDSDNSIATTAFVANALAGAGGDVFKAGNNVFTGQNYFNSGANLPLVIGAATRVDTGAPLEINMPSGTGRPVIYNWINDVTLAALNFRKSRGGSIGTQGLVQSGDGAQINFAASDGTAFLGYAAITGAIDGTPAGGVMPGMLSFLTRDVTGGNVPRMVINHFGAVNVFTGGVPPAAAAGLLTVDAVTGALATASITNWQNAAGSAFLNFRRSRGGTIGVNGLMQQNDPMGSIQFWGNNGNGFTNTVNAAFAAVVDSAPALGDANIACRFVWTTAASGAAPTNEKMRLYPSGSLNVSPTALPDLGPGVVTSQRFFARQLLGDTNLQGYQLTNGANDADGYIFLGGVNNPNSPRDMILLTDFPGTAVKVFNAGDMVNPSASFGPFGCALKGTNTNDNPVAGYVGEVISNGVSSGSPATPGPGITVFTSVALTPGDWELWGTVNLVNTNSIASVWDASISSANNAFDVAVAGRFAKATAPAQAGFAAVIMLLARVSIAAPQTWYIVYDASQPAQAWGVLRARRLR